MNAKTSHGPEESANRDRGLELAYDRTVLANERTYAAWLRTGLCALAAGLAIEKFMIDVLPFWGIRIISVVLILFSGVVFALAAWRHSHLEIGRAAEDVPGIPNNAVVAVSIVLAICSLLAFVGLWLVPE